MRVLVFLVLVSVTVVSTLGRVAVLLVQFLTSVGVLTFA